MRRYLLVLSLMVVAAMFHPYALHAQHAMAVAAEAGTQSAPYTLPPEKMKLAIELFRMRTLLHFAGAGWGIVQLLLLLVLGVPSRLRDVAIRVTKNRWGQGFLFTLLLLLLLQLLDLPLAAYGHHLGLAYGLSV